MWELGESNEEGVKHRDLYQHYPEYLYVYKVVVGHLRQKIEQDIDDRMSVNFEVSNMASRLVNFLLVNRFY